MMTELVFNQAALLAGQLDDRQAELLRILCQSAESSLEARLRDGLTAEDCQSDFVTAASLYALAALDETRSSEITELKAGDLTVKKGGAEGTARCLQQQADRIIQPYLKDSFAFLGV